MQKIYQVVNFPSNVLSASSLKKLVAKLLPSVITKEYKISSIWRMVFIYPDDNLVSKTFGFYF